MSAVNDGRICVPASATRLDELRAHISRASEVADVIELRLDSLAREEFDAVDNPARLAALLRACPHRAIVTLRAHEEGGSTEHTAAARAAFWRRLFAHTELAASFLYADIELALLETDLLDDARINRNKIICSFHDWTGDASLDISRVYERARATGARVIKIATTAADAVDCLPHFRLLRRAIDDDQLLVPIAMGDHGAMTRILALARGAPLAYAALDARSANAPGQFAAAELRDLYRAPLINRRTMLTGLIGSPVAHSLSPLLHNSAFAHAGADAVYLPLDIRDPGEFLRRAVRPTTREVDFAWRGFSVTAPHKERVIEHLDSIDAAARDIGAVNTIVVEPDGTLRGYNTDAAAVLAEVADAISLRAAKVAVIGAGGAARATLWSLREREARTTVFARDGSRAASVAARFGADHRLLNGASFSGFDLVINTTPLGTRRADGSHTDETPAFARDLRAAGAAYDLVYNPPRTRFLLEAEAAGCRTFGGLEMLIRQAALQSQLWTGERAPTDIMRRAAHGRLS